MKNITGIFNHTSLVTNNGRLITSYLTYAPWRGMKLGAPTGGFFHNYDHLADWVTSKAADQEYQLDEAPTIKRLDVDPQAEGRSNE